jgi:hypothetical protein
LISINLQFVFLFKNVKGRDHLGHQNTGGRTVLKWILRGVGCECMDWIKLAYNPTTADFCGHGSGP